MSDASLAPSDVVRVIHPCLARAVLIAREGQTVLYVVPSVEAGREAKHIVKDLGEGVSVASRQFCILSVGTGSLQILPAMGRDMTDIVQGRIGLIVLHTGLRFQDWRQTALAINGQRHGSILAQRADGHVPAVKAVIASSGVA